jgi:dTDP-4-amino-4,6-dideoxygalactose transaminase
MVVIDCDLDDLNMSLDVLEHVLKMRSHYIVFFKKKSIGKIIFVQIDSYFNDKSNKVCST